MLNIKFKFSKGLTIKQEHFEAEDLKELPIELPVHPSWESAIESEYLEEIVVGGVRFKRVSD